MDIQGFITAVLRQDGQQLRAYFLPDAYVNWHNTNEHFTVEEYIRANCEYPGEWAGEIERVIQTQDMVVAVTHVYSTDFSISCHSTSFIQLCGDRIAFMDEYWGDDGPAPLWRQQKQIGTRIK